MSRTTNKIIKGVAMALLVGGALAPGAAAGDPQANGGLGRTPTELGQAVGEPGEGTSGAQAAALQSEPAAGGLGRTPTEIGQAVSEPGDPNVALATRATVSPANAASNGFDWGDAAIGAGLTIIVGIGAMTIFTRRRGSPRKLRTPVASS
jgi:hypothetical protein